MQFQSNLWAYRVAFKIALPLDFLMPTLRVANSLGWTSHKLLQRLENLEKLNETRLVVVGHMYAQKQCMKQYYDDVLRPKNL